jgi:hypothetical protein
MDQQGADVLVRESIHERTDDESVTRVASSSSSSTRTATGTSSSMATTTDNAPAFDRPSVERQRSPSPRRNRHAKGLSLNFPILLPSQHPSTTSTSTGSPVPASAHASPNLNEIHSPTNRTSADFLTLVAAQERRVLELKETLAQADAELTNLKKQWAIFEANKKREEARQLRRLPVPLDEVPSPAHASREDKEVAVEEERRREERRRRALVEMSNGHNTTTNGSGLARKGSKRVFEGRHTRTLSLLSPTTKPRSNTTPLTATIDEVVKDENQPQPEPSQTPSESSNPGTPSLNRTSTFDGLISPDLQVQLNKTYKNLADKRRSYPVPPGTSEFMKQSRQVVDGVREGLWTFFEDIRQATVGDEAVNGNGDMQRQRSQRRPMKKGSKASLKGKSSRGSLKKDDSFWREFGIETPRKDIPQATSTEADTKSHGQKSSTDSQNPPSLLEDLNDEEWDNWESPVTTKQEVQVPLDSEGLPWPELRKPQTGETKRMSVGRTVSDLMREWDGSDVKLEGKERA